MTQMNITMRIIHLSLTHFHNSPLNAPPSHCAAGTSCGRKIDESACWLSVKVYFELLYQSRRSLIVRSDDDIF